MTCRLRLPALSVVLSLALLCGRSHADGSTVPVGTYLYARPAEAEQYKGSLTVRFQTGAARVVVALGRRNRKTRRTRRGTSEAQRQMMKPYRAEPREGGALAVFPHLPPDRYDLVVIAPAQMTLHEGLSLLPDARPELAADTLFDRIKADLSPRADRIGGWEGFFDAKQFERWATNGVRAGVLVQQMRLRPSFAESGAPIQGCIRSVDICWLERAKVEEAGWQVVTRQQLYRAELAAREFFRHRFVSALGGIIITTEPVQIGPLTLP